MCWEEEEEEEEEDWEDGEEEEWECDEGEEAREPRNLRLRVDKAAALRYASRLTPYALRNQAMALRWFN